MDAHLAVSKNSVPHFICGACITVCFGSILGLLISENLRFFASIVALLAAGLENLSLGVALRSSSAMMRLNACLEVQDTWNWVLTGLVSQLYPGYF